MSSTTGTDRTTSYEGNTRTATPDPATRPRATSPSPGRSGPLPGRAPDRHRQRRRGRAGLAAAALLVVVASLTACAPILLPDGTALPPNPTRTGRVGMNVGQLADWGSELPFVDVVKTARAWTPNQQGRGWGQGDPLALDADGWITQLAPGQYGTIVLLNVQGHYPAGRYTLLFDGSGTLQFDPHGVTVVSQEPGRWIVDLAPGQGMFQLHERATDPANPIRNIRLIMPGYEATAGTQPFNPTFLLRMQPFNLLRFLWWMRTSANTAPGAMADWSSRPTRTYAFQTQRGVALEYMIELANQLGVDPWFTLPHDATDDYVRQFATMVRDRLRPDLRVWVEYSNETWNGGYPQSQYVMDHGAALGLSADRYQAGFFFHARRALEMFTIWEDVFGGHTRLKRVLAAQGANVWTGRQVVTAAGGSAHADAIAMAPYFNCVRPLASTPEGAAQIIAMTDDQILDRCETEIHSDIRTQMQQYHDLAAANGLELVAYEGGQHMIGLGTELGNSALSSRLNQVNRNPRMHDVYRAYLAEWRAAGGGEFAAFASTGLYTQYGSFGALEWQDQDPATAPKYRALVEEAA